jgi:hypothetical protein
MVSFEAVMAEAIVGVIAAPLAGVALASRRRLATALAGAIGLSLIVHLGAAGTSADSLRSVAILHATLGASMCALAALGSCYRAAFADVLDAAICGVATSAVLGFGVFLIGPTAIDLPGPLLSVMLITNPLVAVASATSVDLFRGELLYQLSPIAHRQFQYPAWYWAAALYGFTAAAAWTTAANARG